MAIGVTSGRRPQDGSALEDRLGEAAPIDRPAAGEVIRAPGIRPRADQELVRDAEDGVGDIGRPGGTAPLVGDHVEPVALAAKAQHRFDEIRPVYAENPGGAQDHMAVEPRADRPLAGCLACPVDAEGPDRIVFAVGSRLGAVEHVIGGKVDEQDPAAAAASARWAGPSALTANAASGSDSARSTAV